MQLQELREFVKRSGWKLHEKYIDHGYTGSNTKRPDFSKMMIDARQRKFDILLAWKLDSFFLMDIVSLTLWLRIYSLPRRHRTL